MGSNLKGCVWGVEIWDINEPGIHRDGYKIWVNCVPEGGPYHTDQATEDARIKGPITGPIDSGCPLAIGYALIGCLNSGHLQIHPTNNGHPCIL
ncbi:MAG: hypothetical protein LUP99_01860 [Methanomicrobiales archaeon]|nr:hypothetical protein [Methanomicrobiales archaeon]